MEDSSVSQRRSVQKLLPGSIDEHIQTIDPNSTRILYKAKYADSCFDSVNKGIPRTYFHVLENGYELNDPAVCSTSLDQILLYCCCYCPCLSCEVQLFPNVCCRGYDYLTKSYFDRGAFDDGDLYHCLGLATGTSVIYAGDVKCMCFGFEIPTNMPWSGERVRVIPCHTCCLFIPNYSNMYLNCGNTCGVKSGEPLIMVDLASCLAEGEGERLKDELDKARNEWMSRLPSTMNR